MQRDLPSNQHAITKQIILNFFIRSIIAKSKINFHSLKVKFFYTQDVRRNSNSN